MFALTPRIEPWAVFALTPRIEPWAVLVSRRRSELCSSSSLSVTARCEVHPALRLELRAGQRGVSGREGGRKGGRQGGRQGGREAGRQGGREAGTDGRTDGRRGQIYSRIFQGISGQREDTSSVRSGAKRRTAEQRGF